MSTEKKPRKAKSKHKSVEERDRLVAQAKKLITARDRPMTVKEVAVRLGVTTGWLYYNGCAARPLLNAAKQKRKAA